jgi:hypothetical protein
MFKPFPGRLLRERPERDLKGELLGKKTKRTLKPDALPTRPKDKRKARQPNRWISNKEQQASTSQLIN